MKKLRLLKILWCLLYVTVINDALAGKLLIDSATIDHIVKVGQFKLSRLIKQNEAYLKRGESEKLSFVVNINPEDYINDIALSGKPSFLSGSSVESDYNARLNQVYLSQGIECYYILINYFDVKMKAEMPNTYLLKDVFAQGSFFDQNSNIQDLKLLHEVITRNILTTPIASSRKRYVLSLANYCCAEFNNSTGGSGCFRLYSLNKVEPSNSLPVAYFNELFEYYRQYLTKDQALLSESLRDELVSKMITDFEKSASNYKKKALILQTNTVNDLKTILSFFSNEDYQLLSNKERTHIFKIFSGGTIGHTTEIEIISLLNTVPRDSTNAILTDLITVDVNGKRLLKHFFDGFQAGNYKDMVQRLVQLVGNSTLYQHNLPDVETAFIQNQISPSWSKVYEWSDCSTSTMYLDEQNTDECKRPSYWKHAEKRYHTITMSNTGMVEVNGKYKNVTNTINANGSFVVNYENITPSSLHPYDLVFLVDKSTIEGLNDITETSGGTMVVPACFLVYAKDKAFSRDLFEAAMALTSVVGPEEILASKLLSKLSGFKRLLKFARKAESVGVILSYIDRLSPAMKALHTRLVNAGIKFIEEANAVKYVTKAGEEIARIENGVITVTKVKGSIPPTSDYLDATYIINHVNKFKQEGAGFIVVKSWTEQGSFNTMPPRKFAGLRSEMDAVIAKYKANGNDWRILRDELNLGANTDLSAEEIYYVTIDGNDTRFNFDVPNGNEGGAIVGEWTPGGYTKNGTAEIALVGTENIVHNKSITQLISNFQNNYEKIR